MSLAANNGAVLERLMNAATDIFLGALKHTDHGGGFKGLFTLNVDGVPKPVLLVGSAHGSHDDGEVIAVLNPDSEVNEKLAPGVAYNGASLKEIVAGRCDAMVHVWIDAYKSDRFHGDREVHGACACRAEVQSLKSAGDAMPALTLADSLRLAIDVSRDVAAFRGQDADRANALLAMYGEPPAHL